MDPGGMKTAADWNDMFWHKVQLPLSLMEGGLFSLLPLKFPSGHLP